MLRLVKDFIVDVREVRKQKLYGEDACPSHRQCQTLAGDVGSVTGGGGLRVKCMLVIVSPQHVQYLRVGRLYVGMRRTRLWRNTFLKPPNFLTLRF